MLGSVLTYVTLRLLGERANDGDGGMEKGRIWILEHGGATATTSWGKFWLSVLGAFEWSGHNPLPPELWILPYILPFHPERMWCHCRMVYLPNALIYGNKLVCGSPEIGSSKLRYMCSLSAPVWLMKLYVVYMGSKGSADPDDILRQNHQIISAVHGGSVEQAKASHVYSYRYGFRGFATKLTDQQASEVADKRSI